MGYPPVNTRSKFWCHTLLKVFVKLSIFITKSNYKMCVLLITYFVRHGILP